MIKIEQIDTTSKEQVRRFVEIPYRLYANHPLWVPPLFADAKMYLNRKQHPFYAKSEADFFLAVRDGRDVGRIAVFEPDALDQDKGNNRPGRHARFYLFECEEDVEAATALFEQAFAWARARNLTQIIGPSGFTMLDPMGILVEGFDYPQVMDMTTYNYAYYPELIEKMGFKKKEDLFSCHIENIEDHRLPARIHAIADWLREAGEFKVKNFTNIVELLGWVPRIYEFYQKAGGGSGDGEDIGRGLFFFTELLQLGVDPNLIKVITQSEKVIGVVLAMSNLSAALQRMQGQIKPAEIQQEMKRTKGIVFNGLAVLAELQLEGLNVLLFSEMDKTVREASFRYVDMLQVTNPRMQHDLQMIGAQPRQKYRLYTRDL